MDINGRITNSIIDFNFIVDTDIGLLRFIRENFRDNRAFNIDILDKSDRELLSLLSTRENLNPLSIISTDENLKDIDGLYKSFFDNCRIDILNKSMSSSSVIRFTNLMLVSGTESGTTCFVTIHNKDEKAFILKHFKLNSSDKLLNINDKSTIDIIQIADPIYAKDYTFFANIDIFPEGKNLYFHKYKYNEKYITDEDINSCNRVMIMEG